MFHPLAPDLSEVSQEDLYKKYNDLMKRLGQAYQSGPSSAVPQLQMMISSYQSEIARRQEKIMSDMMEKVKKDKDSGGSYDIG
jgi:hypothetical protein